MSEYEDEIPDSYKQKGECKRCRQEYCGYFSREYCSKECKTKFNNQNKDTQKFECRYCGNTFECHRKRNGFCTRSCASKYHYKKGTFDNWIEETKKRIEEAKINIKCRWCGDKFEICKSDREERAFCSDDCRHSWMSREFRGEGNPQYGKTMSDKSKKKRRQTMQEKYGVDNAFQLVDVPKISKPQRELCGALNDRVSLDVELEGKIKTKNKINSVDILIDDVNLIVEYNGSYWHADPREYSAEEHISKKEKSAKDIWKKDLNRLHSLNEEGYDVIVVWEKEWEENKGRVLSKLKEEIYERSNQSSNFGRSSVTSGLADVKEGELLENCDNDVTAKMILETVVKKG